MAQPPPVGGAGTPPGPGTYAPPPYPPYPYYYAPPPRSNGSSIVLIFVILVVVGVAVTVVISAVLYVLVSGLLTGPDGQPVAVSFTAATLAGGNASFTVAGVTAVRPASDFTAILTVDGAGEPPRTIVPAGQPQVHTVSGVRYLVTWTDIGGDDVLNGGDQFAVTGDGVPLPAGRTFAFRLSSLATGSEVGTVTWTT